MDPDGTDHEEKCRDGVPQQSNRPRHEFHLQETPHPETGKTNTTRSGSHTSPIHSVTLTTVLIALSTPLFTLD
jgi:hypothetical protein